MLTDYAMDDEFRPDTIPGTYVGIETDCETMDGKRLA
jgi:hypothetical protein